MPRRRDPCPLVWWKKCRGEKAAYAYEVRRDASRVPPQGVCAARGATSVLSAGFTTPVVAGGCERPAPAPRSSEATRGALGKGGVAAAFPQNSGGPSPLN